MNTALINRPTSFIGKAFWVLKRRPAHVVATARGLILFYKADWIRKILPPMGVELGNNVRLQNNSSVMAEAPYAKIGIQDDSIVYENAKIEAYGVGSVRIGEESVLGDIKIVSRHKITIGKRFLSSWNVFIEDFDPHPVNATVRGLQVSNIAQSFRPQLGKPSPRNDGGRAWISAGWNFPGEPISIGDDVWVGANATILKGAKIGDGCIVATGAVVLRGYYPPNSLIAGNPARVVKDLSPGQ